MEVFSARLKWLREQNKVSQQEMANILGVSQPYYGRFERNLAEPNLETLVNISNYFEESVDFLLGIEEVPQLAKKDLRKMKMLQKRANANLSRLEDVTLSLKNLEKDELKKLLVVVNTITDEVEQSMKELDEAHSDFNAFMETVPFATKFKNKINVEAIND